MLVDSFYPVGLANINGQPETFFNQAWLSIDGIEIIIIFGLKNVH